MGRAISGCSCAAVDLGQVAGDATEPERPTIRRHELDHPLHLVARSEPTQVHGLRDGPDPDPGFGEEKQFQERLTRVVGPESDEVTDRAGF